MTETTITLNDDDWDNILFSLDRLIAEKYDNQEFKDIRFWLIKQIYKDENNE